MASYEVLINGKGAKDDCMGKPVKNPLNHRDLTALISCLYTPITPEAKVIDSTEGRTLIHYALGERFGYDMSGKEFFVKEKNGRLFVQGNISDSFKSELAKRYKVRFNEVNEYLLLDRN